jgi:Zn-dependent peptidase ImmA (M78 family)
MPFTFDVINKTWSIEEISMLDNRLVDDSNRQCYGATRYSNYAIYLSEEMDPQRFMQTLRHEIAHAIMYGSIYTEQDANKGFISEEQVCDFIGNWCSFIEKVVSDYLNYRVSNQKT